MSTRQQQQICSVSPRCSPIATVISGMPSLVIKLTLTIMLALSVSSIITSAKAESEINELNTIAETAIKPLRRNDSAVVKQNQAETRQYSINGFMMPGQPPLPSVPFTMDSCPLCDSSVYSYCSHKLIHDSCCCDFPGSTIYQKPPQCLYTDCALLYAKSCYEHSLIKNCCCNNPY